MVREAQANTRTFIAPKPKVDPLAACRLKTLRSYVGIKEKTGKNDGPEVERFLASTKLGKGNPWCGSCQHCAYRDCDTILKPEVLFSRAAHWHRKEVVIWRWPNDPSVIRPGDHGAVWFDAENRVGHTFCIDSVDASNPNSIKLYTLEGNTNAEGSREGHQFARRIRSLKAIHCVSRI